MNSAESVRFIASAMNKMAERLAPVTPARVHVSDAILEQLFDKVTAEASNSPRDFVTVSADVEDAAGTTYAVEVMVALRWRKASAPDYDFYELERIVPYTNACRLETYDLFGEYVPNDFNPETFVKLFK